MHLMLIPTHHTTKINTSIFSIKQQLVGFQNNVDGLNRTINDLRCELALARFVAPPDTLPPTKRELSPPKPRTAFSLLVAQHMLCPGEAEVRLPLLQLWLFCEDSLLQGGRLSLCDQNPRRAQSWLLRFLPPGGQGSWGRHQEYPGVLLRAGHTGWAHASGLQGVEGTPDQIGIPCPPVEASFWG